MKTSIELAPHLENFGFIKTGDDGEMREYQYFPTGKPDESIEIVIYYEKLDVEIDICSEFGDKCISLSLKLVDFMGLTGFDKRKMK